MRYSTKSGNHSYIKKEYKSHFIEKLITVATYFFPKLEYVQLKHVFFYC